MRVLCGRCRVVAVLITAAAVVMAVDSAMASDEGICSSSGGGTCERDSLSSRLRAAASPEPFPRHVARAAHELRTPSAALSRIFQRLKQYPCRGLNVATFGGSVTWGSEMEYLLDHTLSHDEAWRNVQAELTWGGQLTRFFNEAFPCAESPHTHVNYGLGGSGTAPAALAFHMLGFGHTSSAMSPAPDLVLGEFSVNDDFWGMMAVKESCGSGGAQPHSSSGGKAAARGQCLMLDTLFTESFVRNFMTLGSSVAYIRFGYGFLNNDAGEIHAPVLKHYDVPSWNLKSALLHPDSSINLQDVWPPTRGHPPLEGHVLIAKFIACQLADAFEDLEAAGAQHQPLPLPLPPPLLFHSADAASMKGISLIDFTTFTQRDLGASVASRVLSRPAAVDSGAHPSPSPLFLCGFSSPAWVLEEDVASKRGCISRTPGEALLLPVNSTEGIVYLSYLCSFKGFGAARVAMYRLQPPSASGTLISSTVVDALSDRCFNHKTISLSEQLLAPESSPQKQTRQFPDVYATLGNVIIEIVLERAEVTGEEEIAREGRLEKFKVLSVAAI